MRTLTAITLALALAPALTPAGEALPYPPPPPAPGIGLLPPPPAGLAPAPRAARARPYPRFGLLLDAGVPDGAALAVVYRPLPSLRGSLGASSNGAGYGVQAGLGWTPLRWVVTPSLNLEAGHHFDADLGWLADRAGVPDDVRPLLERVGSRYATAQLGLELGSQRGLAFFLRAGVSYFEAWLRGTGSTDAGGGSGSTGATVSVTDPRLRATVPSAKLGLLLWF